MNQLQTVTTLMEFRITTSYAQYILDFGLYTHDIYKKENKQKEEGKVFILSYIYSGKVLKISPAGSIIKKI